MFSSITSSCLWLENHVRDNPLLAFITVPYLLLYLAAVLPWRNFDKRADISYGVYLYGFSVQQLLVTFGGNSLGYWAYAIISLIATIPFALASYYLIERPFLRLKHMAFPARLPYPKSCGAAEDLT